MQGSALIALFAGATFISLSPIFVRVAEVGPTASAFWRVALAVPFLWLAFFAFRGNSSQSPVRPRLLLAAGVAFAGDLIFWHWSIQYTSVANSTLLANLASIFVTLALWVLWRQRPKALFLAGLAVALAGVVLLVRASLGTSPDGLLGDGLGVVTAMFYAWYILAVKDVRERGASTLYLMAVTTTITALILLPVALISGEALLPPTAASWTKLAGLALISHCAGQGLIAYALAHLPAAFSSVGLLLQPVMAAGFAWVILAEPLSALQAVGGLIVLAGIYMARKGSG
jgi:drug/metabolite transporter (DMT)-like permease